MARGKVGWVGGREKERERERTINRDRDWERGGNIARSSRGFSVRKDHVTCTEHDKSF